MDEDPELWKKLKPGDRVRFFRMPTTLIGYIPEETSRLYEWIVEHKHVLLVDRYDTIDGVNYPWSDWFEPNCEHLEGSHTIMLNDDGLERVD